MQSYKGEPVSDELQRLLDKFAALFEEPHQLPPHRTCDHYIKLVEGCKLVCIRPCKNSYHLNNEMEKLIKEMLAAGLLWLSSSPYASTVMMVKKSDGTWWMYVDYKALNQQTIKDKFLLP